VKKKKTKSLVALVIATAFTVSLTACTGAKVTQRDDKDDPVMESSYVEGTPTVIPTVEETAIDKIESSVPAFKALLDEYYKDDRSFEEILSSEEHSSVLYSSALYVKLREFGLDDETIKEELFNVITFGLVHPFADGWKNDILVEDLNKSLDYSTDAIVYYYPLAVYNHLFDCKEVHETIEGRIKCDKINDDLMEMNENKLFANYVVENVLAFEDDNPLKVALKRIINSGQDVETCIYELENIFKLAIIPRCASEEEWATIAHLDATTEEMENPFEVYYELAVFVHTLHCPEEHYQNEFGQWECPGLRQEMEQGMTLGK